MSDNRLTEVLESFKQGATFVQAVDLYYFDKCLPSLLMEAREHIEVADATGVQARGMWHHPHVAMGGGTSHNGLLL